MWLISKCQHSHIGMKERPQTSGGPILCVAGDKGFLTLTDGMVDHALCGHYDIMFLIGGEGPHLLATGRQTMNSVQTNKVVFCQGHMYEH